MAYWDQMRYSWTAEHFFHLWFLITFSFALDCHLIITVIYIIPFILACSHNEVLRQLCILNNVPIWLWPPYKSLLSLPILSPSCPSSKMLIKFFSLGNFALITDMMTFCVLFFFFPHLLPSGSNGDLSHCFLWSNLFDAICCLEHLCLGSDSGVWMPWWIGGCTHTGLCQHRISPVMLTQDKYFEVDKLEVFIAFLS